MKIEMCVTILSRNIIFIINGLNLVARGMIVDKTAVMESVLNYCGLKITPRCRIIPVSVASHT